MTGQRPEPVGVLVVDKPEGPTSHDVVAVVRRLLRIHNRHVCFGPGLPTGEPLTQRGGFFAQRLDGRRSPVTSLERTYRRSLTKLIDRRDEASVLPRHCNSGYHHLLGDP